MATRISRMFAVMIVAALSFTASANAAPLGLVPTLPDINAPIVYSSFSGDTLSVVDQFVEGLTIPGPTAHLFLADLDMTATINDSGDLQPGGTLTVGMVLAEDYTGIPIDGQNALSVDLTEFGFDGTGNSFYMEFRGTISSVNAALASLFPVGSTVGIIFNPGNNTNFNGWDTAAWSSTQVTPGTMDIFAIATPEIPTPSAAGAMIALAALSLVRRRRQA